MMILVCAFLVLCYVRGWARVRSRPAQGAGGWHAAGFLVGVALIWIAVASPLASGDAHLLTVHMIQHLLLMSLAPPLIWLSDPVRLLRHGLPIRVLEWVVLPTLRWRPLQHVGMWLGHPVACWIAGTATLVAWHVPALLTLGMQLDAWHAIEHASFLGAGLLFWWPVVQPWPAPAAGPRWSIVLYLFAATLPCDVLSGFLVFSERIAYPVYLSANRHATLSVLDDQQLAGALMWTAVTIIYAAAGVIVATRLQVIPRSAGHLRAAALVP